MITTGSVTRPSSVSVIPLTTLAHAATRTHLNSRGVHISLIVEERKTNQVTRLPHR